MVKYINKAKEVNGVALMEVSQSSFGVRTRAKTLALQERLKSPVSSSSPSSGSYLQLRSRRLEKKPIGIRTHETKRQKQAPNLGSMLRVSYVASESDGFVSLEHVKDKDDDRKNKGTGGIFGRKQDIQDDRIKNKGDLGVEEASFGDNVLEIEGRERWVFMWIVLIFFKYIFFGALFFFPSTDSVLGLVLLQQNFFYRNTSQ